MKLFVSFCLLLAAALHCATPSLAAPHSESEVDLSMRGMIRLVYEKPDDFVRLWNARLTSAQARLAPQADEHKELRWQWLAGLINYPYFHHRETQEAIADNWAPRLEALAAIDFDDVQALNSSAFRDCVNAWLHDQAGRLLLNQTEYKSGDNRWLRAKFHAIQKQVKNAKVARFFLLRELTEHVEENGARDIAFAIDALQKLGIDSAKMKAISSAMAQENTVPSDHIAYAYKKVDDVELFAHVYTPNLGADANANAVTTPAFFWFHGGSWEKGHWSYCPILCRALQAQGFTVIQVEYRTSQRFGGTPLDALNDAYDVINWARENAVQLKLKPSQFMSGGFSSGASLASQMAVLNTSKISAAATISGCYDPAADSWYRSTVSPLREVETLSPLRMLNKDAVPQIFFHDKNDEMCPFKPALEMHTKLQSYQIPTQLVMSDAGGHFYPFRSPAEREKIKVHLREFVGQLGWLKKPD